MINPKSENMKIFNFILFFNFFILTFSCTGLKKDAEKRSDANDSIPYIPLITLGDVPLYLGVEVSFNDSISGNFILDTGAPANGLIIDSAFFFDNIDVSKLERQDLKRATPYCAYYKGDMVLSVGGISYHIEDVFVKDYKYMAKMVKGYPYIGLIGEDIFLDKYTILDIDNKKIAFMDSLVIDSSYMAVAMYPPDTNTEWPNRKMIKITGFKDNEGNIKTGRFIFDTGCSPLSVFMKSDFGQDVVIDNSWESQSRLICNVDSLRIGAMNIDNVMIGKPLHSSEIAWLETNLRSGDGLIGMPLIVRFNMILDYKHNILYFKPSKYFDADISQYLH